MIKIKIHIILNDNSYLASSVVQLDPTIECQKAVSEMNTIQVIAYLSKLVKYDTVGNDLFITHLNEIEVNKRVYVVWSLDCGNLQSIENIVIADIVIKNIRKYALNK